ncbi:UsfY protein [Mycolicibacterium fortuitum subsp. acetamidolyticum]|jgi:archaellum biogenesis protein FlaJ (TadC family)|uniref:UsfY protein n=6 Tax=Mycolicibacterium fortuitum TaxID=1766 RepID=A0A378U5U2_MYCFO|nr:UsfY protein [Mycolicibacterium fortuitum subsp. fortuitum]GAT01113.1 UsfY protein [Mycolicibacterium fortuitum subsp. acetamidolyticum]CRL53569.1 UsfY protein [Mycolicibacterium fortuitum subsp. fortuitum DSM 46621 = ATCC 6841 = JCM 6387]CRL80045.1 UsfY protein [Mycolicibacter nonchromogenicus]STZ72787.1 UsfY protein [Mycolicibacterium fortuitum]
MHGKVGREVAEGAAMHGPKDPVDHARTTRPHAGESMKDNVIMPALVLILVGLVLFVGTLAAFATGHSDVGLMVGTLSAAGFIIGSLWLALEHLRVRRIEDRWYSDHPGVMRQRPSS